MFMPPVKPVVAVADQDLAVRAEVDGKLGRDEAGRQEGGELDVRAEASAPARPRVEGAHAVHEQAHVAAAFGRGAQGGGEGSCPPRRNPKMTPDR